MKEYIAVFIGCAVLFAAAVLPDCAYAAGRPNPPMVYYVSPSGNNLNAGTLAAPFLNNTPVNALTLWPMDKVLYECNGIYNPLVVPSSGVADSVITFGSYGVGAKPVITAAEHASVYGSGTGWETYGGSIWYHLLSADDSCYAGYNRNVLMTRVVTQATLNGNNKFRVGTAAGAGNDTLVVYVTAPADTGYVERSKAEALTSNSKNHITVQDTRWTHGTSAVTTSENSANIHIISGTNITIANCKSDSAGYAGIYTSAKPTTIKNTLLINNGSANVYADADSGFLYNNDIVNGVRGILFAANIKGWTIKNNIFVNQSINFIHISTFPMAYTGSNNLFYSTSSSNKWRRGSTNFSTLSSWQDSTGQESGSIVADPRFVNAAAGDYRVLAIGPADWGGTIISSVATDFNGRSRHYPPTIGAYEFYADYSPLMFFLMDDK